MELGECFDNALKRVCFRVPSFSPDDFGTLYTDAFWSLQYELYVEHFRNLRCTEKGYSYIDEIVACLLGGFGFRAEIGWAAYERLKTRHLIKPGIKFDRVFKALSEPLAVGNRLIHYRFPSQKAKYICDFLSRNDLEEAPLNDDLAFRSWLLSIGGIGPKTASWITRNYLHSDNVAIIDIHLYRAGVLTGFVNPKLDIHKDYFEIEKCFLEYCHTLDVKPSIMDLVMWDNMKSSNRIAISLIKNS